jgi:chorismate mutase-like protein
MTAHAAAPAATGDEQLKPLRAEIDMIDEALADLLARRFGVIEKVAKVKAEVGLPAVLPDRVEMVKVNAENRGRKRGINPAMMRRVYDAIVDEACRLEEELIDGLKG